MTREQAAELLGVAVDTMDPFEVIDTFNGSNMISGFLCRQSDHRYGALVIHSVNGLPTPAQVIFCTPKLHYPFGKSEGERHYHWPKVIHRVEVYEKLDGTNVCAYSYADYAGQRFITFKTRLTPVLQSSKFGDFASMWRELLEADAELRAVVADPELLAGQVSKSFEMFGYRNKILVVYPVALATRLLFSVRQAGAGVLPPSGPLALKPEATLTTAEGLTAFYDAKRAEAEALNVKTIDGDAEEISGTEGYVFYVQSSDGWMQFKCKPPGVEDLHWCGDFIPESRIIPTVWNALESVPDGGLTTEYIRTLLLTGWR